MADHDDHQRIARKAYEIWESEGRPHGRDQAHWDQAKEIVALHDSMGDTLLPRDAGAFEPEEPAAAVENYGDVPGLADQGRDDLVDIDREPEFTKPGREVHALGDTAGHVARAPRSASDGAEAEDAEKDSVRPSPTVAAVTPTPSRPMLGVPAPREAAEPDAGSERSQAVVPKSADGPAKPATSGKGPDTGIAPVGNGAATSGTAPTPAASPAGAKAPGGNSPQVTGKAAPKPAFSPAPVTKGRPGDRR